MRKVVIFDLDGTLVDTAPVCAAILNEMLFERGAKPSLTVEQTRPMITVGGLYMIAAFLGSHQTDPASDLDEFRERYRRKRTPADSLYPGAHEAMNALRTRGYGLGLWSNKPQALCEKVVSELGITEALDAVVGTRTDIPLKPDPTGLDLAAALAGGSRRSCCYVGDSEPDILTARAAQIPLVIMGFGYGGGDIADHGFPVAASFAELPELVDSAMGRAQIDVR